MPILYSAINRINGTPYIGITNQKFSYRVNQHIKSAHKVKGSPKFYRAINKYGIENFAWDIILEHEDYEVIKQDEICLIKLCKPNYNIASGGGANTNPKTEEQKIKTSQSLIGRKHPPHWKTRVKGRQHTEKVKNRLRDIGLTEESKEIFNKYRHLGPQSSSKPVICLDDNIIYNSASEAARANTISKSMIIELCLLNPRRKTAGGKRFRYFEDFEIL